MDNYKIVFVEQVSWDELFWKILIPLDRRLEGKDICGRHNNWLYKTVGYYFQKQETKFLFKMLYSMHKFTK